MGKENDVKEYVVEKLKEVLMMMENLWGEIIGWIANLLGEIVVWIDKVLGEIVAWIDKVFPPETRGEKIHHWIQVGAPFLIAGLLLIICICCCRYCCCRGGGRRMMRAPGRPNIRMPRSVFEGNPRSYFRDLRANKSIDDLF